jgi:DNA-binding NtrC family response regulator
MAAILIVDDDAGFRASLAETVVDLGHRPLLAASGEEALRELSGQEIAVIFLDLRMRGMNGLEVLRELKANAETENVPVVILTAFANSANTIDAMRFGAFDHLTKPVGRADVEAVLLRALHRPAISSGRDAAQPPEEELVGTSPAMREVVKMIGLAATSDATVLVLGETGTGKELIVRAIHRHSRQARAPFVAVNCAAIPAELLESELFGHVRGAFTGAAQPRAGKFRDARGGTIFLDEIGDMTLPMQAKMLRVLQDRVITPVGGSAAEQVDVRVLAATHRDLVAMVRDGQFRQDLFYRLHVLAIRLPPLRERGADVLVLAEHILRRAHPAAPKRLSAAAAKSLLQHTWPGNVRELENVLQKANVLVRGPVIDGADLDLPSAPGEAGGEAASLLEMEFHPAVAELEKMLLARALQACGGNRADAARRLGIRRQLLYAKLKEHGLE